MNFTYSLNNSLCPASDYGFIVFPWAGKSERDDSPGGKEK